MIKLFLILIFFGATLISGYSQDGPLNYKTQELSLISQEVHTSILGSDEKGLYIVKIKKPESKVSSLLSDNNEVKAEVFIDQFDHDLNLVRSIPLEGYNYFGEMSEKKTIEFFYLDKDRNMIVVGYTEYEDYLSKFFLVDLDLNSEKFLNEKLIHSQKGIDRRRSFFFVKSKNKDIYGVYSLLPRPNEKFESSLITVVLNNDLQVIKKNEVILPFDYNDRSYIYPFIAVRSVPNVKGGDPTFSKDNSFVLLDTQGNFNFLIKTIIKNAGRENLKDYYYHVFRISDISGEFQVSVLGIADDENLVDIFIHEDESGKLICIGSYEADYNYSVPIIEGIAVYTIDPRNFEDASYSFIKFSPEQIGQLQSKKSQYLEKADKYYKEKHLLAGAPSFQINSSQLEDDGSITLFSESVIVSKVTTTSLSYTMIYGGDVHLLNVNEGKALSVRSIPRNFIGVSDFMPDAPIFWRLRDLNAILFLDSKKYELNLATVNEFGEVQNKFIMGLHKTKEINLGRVNSFWLNEDESRLYFLLITGKYKTDKFLVEVDVTDL